MKHLRIRLRSLLALVLIVGCALGWIANRARVQRSAVAAVKKAGGLAIYDFEEHRGSTPPQGLPPWKRAIADSIGIDFTSSVKFVQIPDRDSEQDRNAALARLGDFENLESVNLVGSSVTDDSLALLGGKKYLKSVMIQHAGISDAGLAHLSALTNLQSLYISACGASDTGLANLEGLTNLESLVLSRTNVTDAGLHHLAPLQKLKTLAIDQPGVTDASIAQLKKLSGLRQLSLIGTSLTRSGVEELQKHLPATIIVPADPRGGAMPDPPGRTFQFR